MKFTINHNELNGALKKVICAIGKNPGSPILSNVLLDADEGRLALTVTDMETTITATINAVVEVPGRTTLPAKALSKLIAKLHTDNLLIESAEDHDVKISYGNVEIEMFGQDPVDFPVTKIISVDCSFVMLAKDMSKMIKKVSFAAPSKRDGRDIDSMFCDVIEGVLTFACTDGRRMAQMQKSLDNAIGNVKDGAVLPIKTASILQKLLNCRGDVFVGISDKMASFTLKNLVVVSHLGGGKYPNYRQVIPQVFSNEVVIPREPFLDALSRISTIITECESTLHLTLSTNKATISATSCGVCEVKETIKVSYGGGDIAFVFNLAFMRDSLCNLDCDEVIMSFIDETKVVSISGDEGFLYVVMPMRK